MPRSVVPAFLTAAVLLALGGSPVGAAVVVVDTLADTADAAFDDDVPCGVGLGSIADLPGADGLVSLREAIVATNNSAGADTITFAGGLSGGTILVDFDGPDADADPEPLPELCGETLLDGDFDGGNPGPDVSLDGSSFAFVGVGVSADGLVMLGADNTVRGLHVTQFPEAGIVVAGIPGQRADRNRILDNVVTETRPAGRAPPAPSRDRAHRRCR